jgi:hypothetical protein
MKTLLQDALIGAALCVAGAAFAAQPPAGAPTGTTGLCKDDTYYSGPTKKGACAGHHGVKEWYGAEEAAVPAAGKTAAAAPAAPTAAAKAAAKPAAVAAPGGGPGLVWVNTSTKVYHCPNTKWYGKTKEGQYLTEADAKAKGSHADHGKACK